MVYEGLKRAANVAREGSQKAEVLDRMRLAKGATLAEIMQLTGWGGAHRPSRQRVRGEAEVDGTDRSAG